MSTRIEILRLLADGELHSGTDIGTRLGISRAAVNKGIKGLSANGLSVQAVPGIGYRLDVPLTPLDGRRIQRHLDHAGVAARIEIAEQVDSTNRRLLALALDDPDPCGSVYLAEVQDQGRGRRGTRWVATPYQNLMMSLAWRFAAGPAMVAGLSLGAGVAVLRALESYGVSGAGLKWPNDILWVDTRVPGRQAPARKLAGLLVDAHGEASGPCTIVLGVGVNCRLAVSDAAGVEQPWVDLATVTGETPDRNRLAALLIQHLHAMFRVFAESGLSPFQADWERHHLYAGRPVRVALDGALFDGIAEGIDAHGALRLRDASGAVRTFHSGQISVRPV